MCYLEKTTDLRKNPLTPGAGGVTVPKAATTPGFSDPGADYTSGQFL